MRRGEDISLSQAPPPSEAACICCSCYVPYGNVTEDIKQESCFLEAIAELNMLQLFSRSLESLNVKFNH